VTSDELSEYRAALAKIDEAVARAVAKAGDALACKRGCAQCCVGDLSVLPVEAAFIEASSSSAPAPERAMGNGHCAFLDVDGACAIYEARPVLCRTHGLALKSEAQEKRAGLRVLGDDVASCELNYVERAPGPAEVLDATKLMMLLVTVDRRFRARAGLPDDLSRVALADLAAALVR
jgi:Fe-S-cluster containining protein